MNQFQQKLLNPQHTYSKICQSNPSKMIPQWKQKQQLKKIKKQKYGQHYNYNIHKPIQNKMFWIQQNRNTQIQKNNRILLQKIQCIFKRSGCKKQPQYPIQVIQNQPTKTQPHLTNNFKSNQLNIDKDKLNHPHQLNSAVIHHQTNGGRKNSHSRMHDNNQLSLNKGIQQAKFQLLMQQRQCPSDKINQGQLNRNLVRLSTIGSMQSRRQKQPRYDSISRHESNNNYYTLNKSYLKPNQLKQPVKSKTRDKDQKYYKKQQHINSNLFNIQISPSQQNTNPTINPHNKYSISLKDGQSSSSDIQFNSHHHQNIYSNAQSNNYQCQHKVKSHQGKCIDNKKKQKNNQ